jgi:valyl-tRNA synthetase
LHCCSSTNYFIFLDKSYDPAKWETLIKQKWQTEGTNDAKLQVGKDQKFVVALPPPNANGNLHAGHVMMIYQDIMCRIARQKGMDVLYIPGTDHAGFETQFVFEKNLAKKDRSRFDYSRDKLFGMINEFVESSKGQVLDQLKQIGFSLDWNHTQYTLDPQIVSVVHKTFQNLFSKGLLYRAEKLVNYCTKDGTSFSDLETEEKNIEGEMYHIIYKIAGGDGHIIVATTRPETLFGDVAVMVHPDDSRYTYLIGKQLNLPLANRNIPIIADEYVDMDFGTGAVKVTPAHDPNDFEVGKRHGLWHDAVIGFDGKMKGTETDIDGLRVKAARQKTLEKLDELGYLIKTEKYATTVKVCYKCQTVIEPLPMKQWFVDIAPLKQSAIESIRSGAINIYPERFKDVLIQILENFVDWNISRQIVWGIQIPAFQDSQTNKWIVETDPAKKKVLLESGFRQDSDTFDTWFSSSQWPFATILSILSKKFDLTPTVLYEFIQSKDTKTDDLSLQKARALFHELYPNSVMETGYDIARAWVARMIMMGIFATGDIPFRTVYFHGMVRDGKGQKMSKSKGNVIDPLKLTSIYGTDALRMALIFGTTPGNDVSLSEEKVKGMRNFINKIWNIGRFIKTITSTPADTLAIVASKEINKNLLLENLRNEFAVLREGFEKNLACHEYSQALIDMYEFIWHRFADYYIEMFKTLAKSQDKEVINALSDIYLQSIDCLEPYIPFVAEAIKMNFCGENLDNKK